MAGTGVEESVMGWNSTLNRKTPLRAKKPWRWQPKPGKERNTAKTPKNPVRMKRAGKRTKEWEATRAKLKVRFERVGITVCELGYPGCWRDNGLTFAHSKKRRNIGPGELEEACLACIVCHDAIEILPEEEMTTIVRGVISRRKKAV